MKRTVLGKTGVWVAALALCVGATLYEMPNIDRVRRYRAHLHTPVTDLRTAALSNRVQAEDPEASDILHYSLQCSRGAPSPDTLATLVATYPENEFLLCQLARQQLKAPRADQPGAAELADRLLTLDPENAWYRYLRGWTLLAGPGGSERIKAALGEFEAGHLLPQLHPPYRHYKQRVDRLCEAAVLGYSSRPLILSFAADLTAFLSRTRPPHTEISRTSFERLTASAAVIANGMIENAYDLTSLREGCLLLRAAHQARLRELDLTETQARETRLQLARAVAVEGLYGQWPPNDLNRGLISLAAHVTWLPLWGIAIGVVLAVWAARARLLFTRAPLIAGILVLLLFTVILIAQSCNARSILAEVPLFEASVVWLVYLAGFALIGTPGSISAPRVGLPASGLLCLNGLMFLVAGRPDLCLSGPNPWTMWLPPIVFWATLCVLLAVLLRDIRPRPARPLRIAALFVVTGWALTLMYADTFGAHWRHVDHLYADSLSVQRPLPQATRETYERVILAGTPAPRGADELYALPAYIAYAGPQDMEAFLARRQFAGQAVTRSQLHNILQQCGLDVRPIILNALQSLDTQNAAPEIPTRPGKRPTYAANSGTTAMAS